MDREVEELIWRRARSLCEYCHFPASYARGPFQIDHIIAQKHQGATASENLALSCFPCNSYKGPNIAGVDPMSGKMVRLFHPRRDRWSEHFAWDGPSLTGRTVIARATIQVLCINHPISVEKRHWLMEQGLFPLNQI